MKVGRDAIAKGTTTAWMLAVVVALAVAGCRTDPGSGDAGRPAGSAPAASTGGTPTYDPPADPCAAVPATSATSLGLTRPTQRSISQFAEAPPPAGLVSYDLISCEWVVANPGRGPNGQPNQMTARVSYAVLRPPDGDADAVARSVYLSTNENARTGNDTTVVSETTAPVPADDGYYLFTQRKSVTGADATVEVAVRRANAVVVVEFSGADLTRDPSRPVGTQLVTTPVAEARLRPTVERMLPDALALLG
jgi:hypothetical protein